MKKMIKLLPLSLLLLSSCTIQVILPKGNENNNNEETTPEANDNPQSTFRYTAPEEEAIVVTKPGVEVSNVEFINIPSQGIKAICFDDAGIKLHVTYSDASTEDFDFLEKHIPIEYRHYLGEVGHHTLTLFIGGVTSKFGFDIVRNKDFNGYLCEFREPHIPGEAGILYTTRVGYYETVKYEGRSLYGHDVDDRYYNDFIGWDYPLEYVHQNMEYLATYKDIEKRYSGLPVEEIDAEETRNFVVSASEKVDEKYNVLAYMGRVYNVAINYGDTVYHKSTDADVTLSYSSIETYNEKWSEINDSILAYGLNYTYNPTYLSYLYGNNGSFTQGATFLSNFETNLTPTSIEVNLRGDKVINTSISHNFGTTYEQARNHQEDTLVLDNTHDDNYYRLALTCSFDIYLSLTYKDLGNDKYELVRGSKMMFAPVAESVATIIQESDNGKFINTYDNKVNFSNETLFRIAKSLNWEA